MTDDNKALQAARAYLARGLSVFPLNGKIPATEHGVLDASADVSTAERWFPHVRNIGVAIPKGVVVVDVDPRNGGDASYLEWVDAYGSEWWDDVPLAYTGGGGFHYWFAYDGRRLKKNPAPGIDLLTHGRFVVAPPSTTTAAYVWDLVLPPDLRELPEIPPWLLVLATPARAEERKDERVSAIKVRADNDGGTDPLAAAARRMTTWYALLSRHGWIEVGDGKWRHPGSDNPLSATIKHDCLFVYSPNTPFPVTEPGDPHGVTLFSALEILDYGGNRKTLIRALVDQGYLEDRSSDREQFDAWVAKVAAAGTGPTPSATEPAADGDDSLRLGQGVDWHPAWDADADIENRWLIEPVIGRARGHALYAAAKTGKSLFALAAAAALASGRPFLDMPAHEPTPVLYCDYEMTQDDVVERLKDFGYTPDELALLHYFLLGSGNGLDTPSGGADLVHDALLLGVELVVVDTTARAIAGAENDADTLRAFYRHTGAPLKRKGIAVVRLDHAGKDATKGQRGTSAKNDDVDLVWRLTALDKGAYNLEATYQRMGWAERTVPLTLADDGETVTWRRRGEKKVEYPVRTKETADALDKLKAPPDITVAAARALLRGSGWKGRDTLIVAAFAWRRETHKHDWAKRETRAETPSENGSRETRRETAGNVGKREEPQVSPNGDGKRA